MACAVVSQPIDESGQSPGAPRDARGPEYFEIFFFWHIAHRELELLTQIQHLLVHYDNSISISLYINHT